MKVNLMVLMVLVAASVACKKDMVGSVSSSAKPTAQTDSYKADKTEVVIWEYTRRYVGGEPGDKVFTMLNEMGSKGWELVGFTQSYLGKSPTGGPDMECNAAFFKRPKK